MSFSSLPEEIQVDTFLRLPVNSILLCRCVCKVWHSLLTNPKFTKDHLINHTKNNLRLMVIAYDPHRSPTHVIFSTDYDSVKSLSSRTSSTIDFPFEYIENLCSVDILGSCNGLVSLCINCNYDDNGVDNSCLCLWNPCTGEYKNIPIPAWNNLSGVSMRYNIGYGFGYDCQDDDYKLVCIPYSADVLIYTLRSDSWRSTRTQYSYRFPGGRLKPGLLFKGALHWSCHNEQTSNPVIVSFDISTEKLFQLRFPEPYRNIKYSFSNLDTRLGVLEDRLCLVCSKQHVGIDTWVMQDYGVTGSWTKLFTTTHTTLISYNYLEPIWSFRNGEILMNTYGRFFLINPRNGGVIMSCSIPGIDISELKSQCYVESLVSVNSGTYVEKRRRI